MVDRVVNRSKQAGFLDFRSKFWICFAVETSSNMVQIFDFKLGEILCQLKECIQSSNSSQIDEKIFVYRVIFAPRFPNAVDESNPLGVNEKPSITYQKITRTKFTEEFAFKLFSWPYSFRPNVSLFFSVRAFQLSSFPPLVRWSRLM